MARGRGEVYRGCGLWPYFGPDSPLEPPWEPFRWSGISEWDLAVGGLAAAYQGRFFERLKRLFLPARATRIELDATVWQYADPLSVVSFRHYPDDEVTSANAEQLLLALGAAHHPIAFEVFGTGGGGPDSGAPRIEPRFIARRADVPLLKAQLHALYPRSAVASHQVGFHDSDHQFAFSVQSEPFFASPLCLGAPYCFPIRTFRTAGADPLAPLLAVMDRLAADEWGLLQVVFARARRPWAENLRAACEDPYNPRQFLVPGLDHKTLAEKLRAPLFAASVTLAANRPYVLAGLASFVHQFEGPHNRLAFRNPSGHWPHDGAPQPDHWRGAILTRQVLTPGLLVNVDELASVVHVPSQHIPSDRLVRVSTSTRQPPITVLSGGHSVIGQNFHRGHVRRVAIPAEVFHRHTYIVGATGMGKSTLLSRLIIQDMAAGHGVGLLDPAGDLSTAVLRHVPRNRVTDVLLFDCADTAYPVSLNILEARDEAERERIATETVSTLERQFPASWGPRLESVLQYTIRLAMDAIPGATLGDVERLLTVEEYREAALRRAADPRLVAFWNSQFKTLPRGSLDPVLNKLNYCLVDRHARNILCQRRAAVNFDQLLNQGKILLANLSTGLLTEKVAGILGGFLVTKIANAAFRRAALPPSQRRPWHLYIDEFQNFMNLSVGFERILAEARKYGLALTVANQHVGQLSQAVRQAIFGNTGSLIAFRVGIEDAQIMARELGGFTAQDILSLEVGHAIARCGGSGAAFNLETFREPPAPPDDPTRQIVALARQRYARPRQEVERELAHAAAAPERRPATAATNDAPSDPNEDDLVA